MNIILWIVLGGIAGWVASAIMGSGQGILGNVILGIIGSLVGGLLADLLGGRGITGFNLYSLALAIIGSIVLIYLGRLVRGGDRAKM